MTTETSCPYCDSSVYVRLDRDLLAGGEPFRFHGEWSPDEPEAWETFTLQVHGKEAADVADITADDLVKIVRRGVESGTIEGEVVEDECPWCAGDGCWEESNPLPGYSPGPAPMTCPYCKGVGRVLVIPRSTGGET